MPTPTSTRNLGPSWETKPTTAQIHQTELNAKYMQLCYEYMHYLLSSNITQSLAMHCYLRFAASCFAFSAASSAFSEPFFLASSTLDEPQLNQEELVDLADSTASCVFCWNSASRAENGITEKRVGLCGDEKGGVVRGPSQQRNTQHGERGPTHLNLRESGLDLPFSFVVSLLSLALPLLVLCLGLLDHLIRSSPHTLL